MAAGDVDPSDPPPIAAGCVPAAPDFVGLGVQKAGTTWWYDVISAHPAIHHPPDRPKELHFFDRFWGEPFDDADVECYHRWFSRPPGTVAGEWTPRYLHDWWVPPLVARAAPGALVLVMLRDPVERYLSGIAHELGSRGRRDPAIPGDAVRRSCYAAQLERLWASVPPERTLVLQFERCVASPLGERGRTWSFLGLGDPEDDPEVPPPANVTLGTRPSLPESVTGALRAELAADLERLLGMGVDLDPQRWTSVAELLG